MDLKVGTYKNYVDGQWVESRSGKTLEIKDPGTGEMVSRVESSTLDDLDELVTVAKRAFVEESWAFNPRGRSAFMNAWAGKLRENMKDLAEKICYETGKPLSEAMGEMMGAIGYLEYYAAASRTLYGTHISVDENTRSILEREPIGVVAIIVPWNYPITLLMRDMAPALAAGNAVIVKPASQTSGATMACLELLEGLPIPNGIIGGITGSGAVIGEGITKHPDIGMVNFTGSSDTGKRIMESSATTMKKISLELGGKSASIIFADADLKKAVPMAIKSIFTNAGQLCTSASRLLIEATVFDQVTQELKERAENLQVGRGLDEGTEMGAITLESQMNTILEYIEIGKRDGEILCGGQRLREGELKNGYFIQPTIIIHPKNDSPVVQEEVFGPVLTVQSFTREEEAVELANSTVFGLASGVFTRDINKGMRVARKLKAGTVWVNTYNRLLNEAETGGYRESGIGRSGGAEGIKKFTEVKHVCIDFNE